MGSRDFFPNILRVLHPNPNAAGGKPVAFLEIYLDESGHSTTHPFLIIAGYMAPAENWIGFYGEWNAALVDAGAVKADGAADKFHMADLEAFKGIFAGWDEDRRRALLGALFEIIDRHRLYAIGFAVSVEWWNSRNFADSAPEHEPLNPWHWAAQGVIQTAWNMTNEPQAPELLSPESVAFVFDLQSEYGGTAKELLPTLCDILSGKKATVAFSPSDQFPQLQAADIVAFELRWRLTRPDIPIRWPLRQMVNSQRVCFSVQPPELNKSLDDLGGISEAFNYTDRVQKRKTPKTPRE